MKYAVHVQPQIEVTEVKDIITGYTVSVIDVDGVHEEGKTLDEALINLKGALLNMFTHYMKEWEEIPLPNDITNSGETVFVTLNPWQALNVNIYNTVYSVVDDVDELSTTFGVAHESLLHALDLFPRPSIGGTDFSVHSTAVTLAAKVGYRIIPILEAYYG